MNLATNINNNVDANSGVRQVTKNILAAVLLAAGCASAMAATNVPPVVKFVSVESNGAVPATIKFDADATDSDGSIAKVEFFDGTTLLGSTTQAPYTFTWTGVAVGTYSVTAKATDNIGAESVTAVSSVVVGASSAKAYYVHSDQIDTAKLITNDAGQAVWKLDLEPFGANLPDENPHGQGAFLYNNRFPGQYFDRETGLHYNYYRDYDPQTGRYIQSDPIGLLGGINTFNYVEANPVRHTDTLGLTIDVRSADLRPAGIPEMVAYSAAKNYLVQDPGMAAAFNVFDGPNGIDLIVVVDWNRNTSFDDGIVYWNPAQAMCLEDDKRKPTGQTQSSGMGLGHEIGHAAGGFGIHARQKIKDVQYKDKEERRVIVEIETPAAKRFGESVRKNHFGRASPLSATNPKSLECGCQKEN